MTSKRSLVHALLLLSATWLAPVARAQSAGTFTATGSMDLPRVGHTATLLPSGKVLICGGLNRKSSLGTVWAGAELYDPASRTFTPTGNMTTPRLFHTATLLPDGRVLIAGGSPIAQATAIVLASSELYDPATGAFAAAQDMLADRMWHTATLLNSGKVLITGGIGRVEFPPSGNSWRLTAELYDPATGAFSATGKISTPRTNHTATLLPSGKVMVAGGYGSVDGPINWVEIYNPESSAFDLAGAAGTIDSVGPWIVSVLTSGRTLIAMNLYDTPTTAAKLYDAASGTFIDTGSMRAPRQFSATLLSGGNVLIAGYAAGLYASRDGRPSADVYGPAFGRFSPAGEMMTPRFDHTATLLQDGTVLIAGGMTSPIFPSAALASAEIYHPDVLAPAPVLFSLVGDNQGQGAIQHGITYEVVSPDNPAVAGEILIVYCRGLDDASVIPPQVAIGGRMAETIWFGKTPGYAGLNQVNVRMPSGVLPGPAVPVRLIYLNRFSNEATIGVR